LDIMLYQINLASTTVLCCKPSDGSRSSFPDKQLHYHRNRDGRVWISFTIIHLHNSMDDGLARYVCDDSKVRGARE